MFQDRTDDRDVEFTELRRQPVNVAVEYFRLRLEQAMAQPVGVLPALDFGPVFLGPARAVAGIEFVFERKKRLLGAVALIERDHPRRAPLFGLETEEAGRSADIEDRFSRDVYAADIIIETTAQVPVRPDQAEARQLHRMIKETVLGALHVTRRCEKRRIPGRVAHAKCGGDFRAHQIRASIVTIEMTRP